LPDAVCNRFLKDDARMLRRAACLTFTLLTACAAETPGIPAPAAHEPTLASVVLPEGGHAHSGPGDEARAFFFAQTELYLAGADPAQNEPLADVLRAMGRGDLAQAAGGEEPGIACPQLWVDPVEMVSQNVQDAHIVIIETQRSAPEQIAFVGDIFGRLAGDGFTAYADDSLTLDPAGADHPGIPLVTEGQVTRDPGHGRLLRAAKSSGMTLVDAGIWWRGAADLAALTLGELAARRQLALADQLSRKVFWANPSARAVVHIESTQDPSGTAAFRDVLKRLTGFDPLVIGLTSCIETDERPAYLPALGDEAGSAARADLVFAVPQETLKGGRMVSGRARADTLVDLPDTFLNRDRPILVEARRLDEPDLAVPEDRLLLLPGDRLPLILPPGAYRIEAWTREGPLGGPVRVTVSPV
jgi:hypothetical protein